MSASLLRKVSDQSRRRRPSLLGALTLIIGAGLTYLVLGPILTLFARAFFVEGALDLSAFRETFGLRGLGRIFLNTTVVLLASGTLALMIGSAFAWANERTDARLAWLSSLPVVAFVVPPIASSIGWVLLLSPRPGLINVVLRSMLGMPQTAEGPLNIFSWPGIVFVYTLELVPYVFLLVAVSLRNLNVNLEEASRVSGAGPLRTLWRVTLPAVKPALGAAVLLIVVLGLAIFSVPAIIGTPSRINILSAEIVRLMTSEFPPRLGPAMVLSILMLLVIVAASLGQRRIVGAGRFSVIGGKTSGTARVSLHRWRWPVRFAMLLYVGVAIVLPLVSLVLIALQPFWSARYQFSSVTLDNFRSVLGGGQALEALLNSSRLGVAGATITVSIAMIIALYVTKYQTALGSYLDSISKLPAAFSHLAIAIGVLLLLGGAPFNLIGTLAILLIAYTVIYLPHASVIAGPAIASVGGELHDASRMSGAGEFRTFSRISLPLMLPGLAVAWTLVFVVIIGDLSASVILSSVGKPTAGFVLFDRYENGSLPLVAAMASLIAVFSLTVIFVVLRLARGRLDRAGKQ